MDDGLSVTTLGEAQWFRLSELFQEVFGHPLDAGLAAWKYGPDRGLSVAAVSAEGRVMAHCGLIFRDLLAAGVPTPGAQIGDLMVAPVARGGLARQASPFYQVVAEALESMAARQPSPVVFGFPSDRAMRVGERLGLFAEIDQVFELVWPSTPDAPRSRCLSGNEADLSAWADHLWRLMAADLPDALVGVRHGAYLMDRYVHHPVYTYQLFLLRSRWLRVPQGIFVLRCHGDWVELMDWVAPLARGVEIIAEARRAAASLGAQRLVTWLARSHAPRFAQGASSCQPMEFRILASGRVSLEWLTRFKDRWWLTSGDTDYR